MSLPLRRGPLPAQAEVVVIGGGALGASITFHLAEQGVDVLLLERDALASGSSGKPIGGVRAQFSDPLNVALGSRSLRCFEDFTNRPGADIGLNLTGYLFLLPTEADVDLFRTSVAMQNEMGVPSRIIDMREASLLCPYVDPTAYVAAVYSPEDGWAYPSQVVEGYVAGAERLGAGVRTDCAVTAIDTSDGVITAVVTEYGTVATQVVVCCAGAWSPQVGAMVGVDLPIVPLKRQIAFSPPFEPRPPVIPFTIDFRTTLYFHNAGEGLLMGIADRSQAPGYDVNYGDDWLPLLRDSAARCCPSLADMAIESGWAGLYETTPDNSAVVGESARVGRFLYAAGFSGHGFLQAPAIGEVVRDLYLGRTPFVDVSALSVERFTSQTVLHEANII